MLNLVEEEDGSDDAIVEYSDPNINNPFKILQSLILIKFRCDYFSLVYSDRQKFEIVVQIWFLEKNCLVLSHCMSLMWKSFFSFFFCDLVDVWHESYVLP